MLKRLIFAGMALFLLGPVAGSAMENSTLLPNLPFVSNEELSSPMVLPSPQTWTDVYPNDIISPLPKGWTRVGTIINHHLAGQAYLSIFEMIQGRVAGVWVSGSYHNFRMRIRGALGPPLVVIDGLPFYGYNDNDINSLFLSISPSDVDYIEVLKGITETAIYGPGSGNGVIVVHTKQAEW